MSKNREFAEALSVYASELLNGFGWAPWTSLETEGSATVNMSLDRFSHLVVKAVETHEGEVTSLEEELKEAKKTIKAQSKEIESLTAQLESEQAQVEEEVAIEDQPDETPATEELTQTRRKRKT